MKKFFFLLLICFPLFCFSQSDYYLAQRLFNRGEYKQATQLYESLYEKSPFNSIYLSKLISCYQETEDFLKAEKLLKTKVKLSPNNGYLYVFLGYNYQLQNKIKASEKQYKLALKTVEKKPTSASVTGRYFKEYNLLDYAIITYKKAMELNNSLDFHFQIGQISAERGDLYAMFTAYINLLDKNYDYLSAVKKHTNGFVTSNSKNEANIILKKIVQKKATDNPKDVWNILLSWLFVKQKDFKKALIQEKTLFKRNNTIELNTKFSIDNIYELGKTAFDEHALDEAKNCFDFVIENTNSFNEGIKIEAYLYLIKIFIAQDKNNIESFFSKLFKEFGKTYKSLKIQIAYADFLTFQKKNPVKALDVLETALKNAKTTYDKAKIKVKLADVLVFTENYDRALIYYSQVQTQLKDDELAQIARLKVARTSYFRGDFKWAKTQLKVLKSETTQLTANDAIHLYLLIIDNEPVDSLPSGLKMYAKADLLSFQNKTKQAIDVLTTVLQRFKGMPIEDEALFKQAELFTKQKEYEKAINNYEKITKIDAEGILVDDAIYKIAELYYYNIKDKNKAFSFYKRIMFDYPSSIHLVDARKKFRKIRGDSI